MTCIRTLSKKFCLWEFLIFFSITIRGLTRLSQESQTSSSPLHSSSSPTSSPLLYQINVYLNNHKSETRPIFGSFFPINRLRQWQTNSRKLNKIVTGLELMQRQVVFYKFSNAFGMAGSSFISTFVASTPFAGTWLCYICALLQKRLTACFCS